MSSLHPWAASIESYRSGGEVPISLPGEDRLTWNQGAGAGADGCERTRHAPPGHPLGTEAAAAEAARRLVDRLNRERHGGLWGGEGPSSYALQHCLARACALTAIRGLRRRYESCVDLQEAHVHLIAWWRGVATLALEWRGARGVVRGVGDRAKHTSVDEEGGEDALGLDIVADAIDPMPAGKLHPKLRLRLREMSLEHPHYTVHRRTHRMLILELRSLADHLTPLVLALGADVLPRLQEAVYWRHDPGIHLLMPVAVANPDSDGRRGTVDPVVRWDGVGYTVTPGPVEVQKGVSVTWEEQEDANGNLVRNVFYRAIQGVRAGTHLPHPDGAAPLGGNWTHAGPDTPPYPLPSLEEVDAAQVVEPTPPPPSPGTPSPPPNPPTPAPGAPAPDPGTQAPQVSIVARRHLQLARKRVSEALSHVERKGERPVKSYLKERLDKAQRQLSLLQQDLRIEGVIDDPEADA